MSEIGGGSFRSRYLTIRSCVACIFSFVDRAERPLCTIGVAQLADDRDLLHRGLLVELWLMLLEHLHGLFRMRECVFYAFHCGLHEIARNLRLLLDVVVHGPEAVGIKVSAVVRIHERSNLVVVLRGLLQYGKREEVSDHPVHGVIEEDRVFGVRIDR